MILAKLVVALGIDTTEYSAGLDHAEHKASASAIAIGRKFQDVGGKMVGVGNKISLAVTAPLAAFGAKAIAAASDLNESMNKVDVIFGESAMTIQQFAGTSASALGISQQAALEATGTFGNLFTAMGISQPVAAEMSTKLVTLAADLASFNNIDPTQALEKLRAGLVGEAEPLRTLGVNLTASSIALKAMEMGLVDVSVDMNKVKGLTLDLEKAQVKLAKATEQYGADSLEARDAAQGVADAQSRLDEAMAGTVKELTSAQKAQAAYALIMEQTRAAQGDFARTSTGLANQTRIIKAQLGDLAAVAGQHLLPVGLKLAEMINGLLDRFQALNPEQQKTIVTILAISAAIGPLLVVLGTLSGAIGSIISLVGTVGPALGGVAAILTGPVGLAIAAVVGALALLYAAWKNDWGGIRTTLTEVWETKLKPVFDTVVAWLKVTIPLAIAELKRWWEEKLLPALQAVWNFLETYIFPLFEALANVWIALVKKEIEILAALWSNVLLPALKDVWTWISENILPIFAEVARVVVETLGPSLQWLKEHVLEPVWGAFKKVGDIIGDVINWLKWLADQIGSIELPSWLQPGSATPFEIGLRGIAAAMRELSTLALPELRVGLAGIPPLAGAAAGGMNLGGIQIHVERMDVSSRAAAEGEARQMGYLLSEELRRRGLLPRGR